MSRLGLGVSCTLGCRMELALSGAPSCRVPPGCLWGFPCLVNGCVVLVVIICIEVVVEYIFDVAVCKPHACLPEKIDSYLILSYLILVFRYVY